MVAGRQRSQPGATVTSRPRHAAVRAEPRGIGSAGARDPLAREVRLLGALLGQVIVEQGGPELFELIERLRRAAIQGRRGPVPGERADLWHEIEQLDAEQAESVIRAFNVYFQLANLAEERHRARLLARRERAAGSRPTAESLAGHVARLQRVARAAGNEDELLALVQRLRIAPVLTAHPTEVRRRTLLVALRRLAGLIERLDDPRLTPTDDREVRRRLREEIALLWRTAVLRGSRPTPLDEVRTALVFFDETIYSLVPRLYRALDTALGGSAVQQPSVPAFLHLGSWVGGDRDGHPAVTAEVTERTLAIHADHVLRGHEAVASRLMQTIAPVIGRDATESALRGRLARDAEDLPEADRMLTRRFPDEPFRVRFGFIAERLRRTRAHLTRTAQPTSGRYLRPEELVAELAEIQAALVAHGLPRSAWGDVQDFRWQVETFGFHLAALEVRQHAAVHRAALAAIDSGHDPAATPAADGVTVDEVLKVFPAMGRLQERYGPAALSRVIVSFTTSAADALAVLALARHAVGPTGDLPVLDVVPLFESADALSAAGRILGQLLDDPEYRRHLAGRADRQEVMLGYSDSNKESGFLAANWLLHRAQADLVAAARRRNVELTLFHGRGGAIGRGGGWPERAILGQPPGSVDGRLKITEQGEIVAARYADPIIARNHLEVLTGATLVASLSPLDPSIEAAGAGVMDELAAASSDAYRRLVTDDAGFAGFFARITPIDELAELHLGSRPSARPGLGALRAIPWVFAWSQARIELPGWYGLGAALEAYEHAHGLTGIDRIAELYRHWPFLASIIDHAELALARSDVETARRYAALATAPGDAARWAAIEAEHARSARMVSRVTGRSALLESAPDVARSLRLRGPYIEALSALQVHLLRQLREHRSAGPADAQTRRLEELVRLAVSGVAAGLQSTG